MAIRSRLLLIIILLYRITADAQTNLVPNPGFENIAQCPTLLGQIHLANGWFSANGTPDLFHSCTMSNVLGVPANGLGYQNAVDGNGYGHFYSYSYNNPNYREIPAIQLTSTLQIGMKYYISFFVSKTDTSSFKCSTNGIGIKLSKFKFDSVANALIDNMPLFYYQGIISNTYAWTAVSGSVVADSNYSYLYIGNFFDDFNTDTLGCLYGNNGHSATYYLDQVCLSTDSLFCTQFVGIKDHMFLVSNLYSESNDLIFSLHGKPGQYIVRLVDLQGRVVLNTRRTLFRGKNKIEIPTLEIGVYIAQFLSNKHTFSRKFVIQ